MPTPRIVLSTLGASAVFLLTAYSNPDSHATLSAQTAAKVGNPITGEGLPNPAPKVTRNWGELPAGRKWGTSAGIDIDPKDGNIWAYERCGAGTAGGGRASIATTPRVDPVFKFDRHTGSGAGELRQGRHGDAARHLTSTRTATCGLPTSRATRRAPRDTRSTSSARRARSC